MKAIVTHLPALQVVVPLFGAFVVALLRRGTTGWLAALVVTWLTAATAVALLVQVLVAGPISYQLGGWAPPWGIEYRVDALSAFVLVLVAVVGAAVAVFAKASVEQEIPADRRTWFYTMYLLCLSGLLGITITGDAFNLFVFLEISSLSAYVLIALGKDRRALLAAYQYLIVGTIGATFYVIGVGLLYLVTGSLNIVDIAQRLGPAAQENSRPVIAAFAFLTVGISLKLALFPLHVWLPGAYAYAPSITSAFLAGTATKVAIYVLIRLFFSVFGVAISLQSLPIAEILLTLSVAAMLVASTIAVFEENTKRMLAYSSLAQVGYITLGIGLANVAGLTGSIVHLLNHAVMKTTLFLALGAIVYRIGTVELADLAGVGRRMPLTMVAFLIAGLAIIGVPGTAGFISKWYLAVGAFDRGWWALAVVILVSSMLALLYIGRVVEIAWFREPSTAARQASDPPLTMLVPILVLAAATIYLGIATDGSAGIAGKAATQLLGGLK